MKGRTPADLFVRCLPEPKTPTEDTPCPNPCREAATVRRLPYLYS